MGLDRADVVIAEAARIATAYLSGDSERGEPVIRHLAPEVLCERLDLTPPQTGRSLEDLLEGVRTTLRYSVRTGHPGFSNQLFGGHDMAALLGEWMTALLNTSMYTYEVAPVVTLMETELIRHMCTFVGWDASEGEGVFTPGGSIANLMALIAGRNRLLPSAKESGLGRDDRLVLFASEEAHYSIDRAASVAGLGTGAVRKVAVDELGRMIPQALEAAVLAARAEGSVPFFVCATASTTVAGAFDPIDRVAAVAREHGLWLHVDAACGGAVLLSKRHRGLMQGSEHADSLTWNPHKLMGLPLTCSTLLVREPGRLATTNAMGASYLFHDNDEARFDLGDLSLQCGRRVDALKLWLSWRALGDDGHARRIESLFELATSLRDKVVDRDHFELVREPQGCNVCFRYVPQSLQKTPPGPDRGKQLGALTIEIREHLRREGRILTNYAVLDGVPTFRYVASNPRATDEDLQSLLSEIERIGASLSV